MFIYIAYGQISMRSKLFTDICAFMSEDEQTVIKKEYEQHRMLKLKQYFCCRSLRKMTDSLTEIQRD